MKYIKTYADEIAAAKRDLSLAKNNETELIKAIQKHVFWSGYGANISDKMKAAVHYLLKKEPYGYSNIVNLSFFRDNNSQNPDVGFVYIDENKDRFGTTYPIKVVQLKNINQLRLELGRDVWHLAVEKDLTEDGYKTWRAKYEKMAPLKYLEYFQKIFVNQLYMISHRKLGFRNIVIMLPNKR